MTAEVGTDARFQLGSGEQARWLDDGPFAMDPLRFNRVEPGGLDRQLAGEDADAASLLLDLVVVRPDPALDRPADVPGGVVPDEKQGTRPAWLQTVTTVGQELGRDRTHGMAIDKAQPEFVA